LQNDAVELYDAALVLLNVAVGLQNGAASVRSAEEPS
jgi:hypothetical protein